MSERSGGWVRKTKIRANTNYIIIILCTLGNKKIVFAEKEKIFTKFLAINEQETKDADATALKYVSEFHLHAARKLFATIAKIQNEVDLFHSYNIKWRYFRRIRLLLMTKKIASLHSRQKVSE